MISMCEILEIIPNIERKDVHREKKIEGRRRERRKMTREKEDGDREWKNEQCVLQYGRS